MIYDIRLNDGTKLKMDITSFTRDGSGTRIYKDETLIADFYSGRVYDIYPEDAKVEAEYVKEE